MRAPTTRRLVVVAAACLATGLIAVVPARGYTSVPLLGGVTARATRGATASPAAAPTPSAAPSPGGDSRPSPEADPSPAAEPPEQTPAAAVTATAAAPSFGVTPAPRGASSDAPGTAPEPATVAPAPPPRTGDPTPGFGALTARPRTPMDLKTPPTITPDDVNQECNTERTTFTVSWTPVTGATEYLLSVGGATTASMRTRAFEHEVTCPIGTGPIRLQVTPLDGTGREGAVAFTTITQHQPLGGPGGPRALLTAP